MAGVWAVLATALYYLLCTLGWLLLVVLVLLCIVLFVPTFVDIVYQEDEITVVAGILCVRVHLYPRVYFLWDIYANETGDERATRLAKKEEKRLAKQAKKDAKKLGQDEKKALKKGVKITLETIITLLQTAGMVMRIIFGALKITNIRLRLPVQEGDAAKTATQYGKTNAWVYGTLAALNNFLYLDFDEVQIIPVFAENFAKDAYFSCKVSARLFIIGVVLYRLYMALRDEKEILALLTKGKGAR